MDILNNKNFSSYNEYKKKDYVNFHTLYNVWNKSLLHDTVKEETLTEEMILGSIIHLFILENVSLDELVLVVPKLDKRKKGDKDMYEIYLEQASKECKYVIDENTHMNILNMYDSLYDKLHSYSEYEEILECFLYGDKEKENLFTYNIHSTSIKCKSLLDISYQNKIIDLKTTVSSNPNQFIYDIKRYGYDYQLMYYSLGMSINENQPIEHYHRYIVSIEKFYPYDVVVYEVPYNRMYIEDIDNMFEKYIYQKNNSKYNGYSKNIIRYEYRYGKEV